MRVLCFLPPQPLAQIRRALPRPHLVENATTWEATLSGLHVERCDIAVIDPCAGSASVMPARLDSLSQVFHARPATPIIGYVSVSAAAMRAVHGLVRLGVTEIVIRGVDDSTEALATTIHRTVASNIAACVVRTVGTPFESLPHAVALAIEEAFLHPSHVRSVADLAAAAKTTRRSLDRWLARSGIASARTVLACARVNGAFQLLASGTLRLRQAAASLGYPSARSLARDVYAVTGYPVSAIPLRLSRQIFVATLERRLLRTAADSPTVAVPY